MFAFVVLQWCIWPITTTFNHIITTSGLSGPLMVWGPGTGACFGCRDMHMDLRLHISIYTYNTKRRLSEPLQGRAWTWFALKAAGWKLVPVLNLCPLNSLMSLTPGMTQGSGVRAFNEISKSQTMRATACILVTLGEHTATSKCITTMFGYFTQIPRRVALIYSHREDCTSLQSCRPDPPDDQTVNSPWQASAGRPTFPWEGMVDPAGSPLTRGSSIGELPKRERYVLQVQGARSHNTNWPSISLIFPTHITLTMRH